MSCRRVCSILCASLLCPSSAAAASEPLRTTKPWVLDYADAQCLASRDYPTGDRQVTLAIRPAPSGATYELFVVRDSPGPMFAEEREGSVDFGRGTIKTWLLHYRIPSTKRDAFQFRITALEMEQARSASSVTLNSKNGANYSFTLQSMPDLLNGLAACTADLRRYWNMEESQAANIAIPSKGDLRRIFSSGDYPWEAQKRSQQGTVQSLLLVDETGKVAACHVELPSKVPAIDAMGCIVIRERAKFEPARNGEGKPVRSSLTTPPIVWRLM